MHPSKSHSPGRTENGLGVGSRGDHLSVYHVNAQVPPVVPGEIVPPGLGSYDVFDMQPGSISVGDRIPRST